MEAPPEPPPTDIFIETIWFAIDAALAAKPPVSCHDIAGLLRTMADQVERSKLAPAT